MAQSHPARHADTGVYLAQNIRVALFNLDRSFEAHRMLYRYGLIETLRDPRRKADGTIVDFDELGAGEMHRFKLNDSTLNQPAFPRVTKALDRFAAGVDTDIARMMDAGDELMASGQLAQLLRLPSI